MISYFGTLFSPFPANQLDMDYLERVTTSSNQAGVMVSYRLFTNLPSKWGWSFLFTQNPPVVTIVFQDFMLFCSILFSLNFSSNNIRLQNVFFINLVSECFGT